MFDLLTSLQAICVDESRKFSQREHAYLLMLSLIRTYKPRRKDRQIYRVPGWPPLVWPEIEIGLQEGKIPCIKAYKERANLSLIDAKRVCEETFEKLGYKFKGH